MKQLRQYMIVYIDLSMIERGAHVHVLRRDFFVLVIYAPIHNCGFFSQTQLVVVVVEHNLTVVELER